MENFRGLQKIIKLYFKHAADSKKAILPNVKPRPMSVHSLGSATFFELETGCHVENLPPSRFPRQVTKSIKPQKGLTRFKLIIIKQKLMITTNNSTMSQSHFVD